MVKNIIFTSVLSLLFQLSYASQNQIDSLLKLVDIAEKDTAKVNLLNRISWLYYRIEPNETVRFAVQALQLAENLEYKKGMAEAFNRLGIGHLMISNKSLSLKYFNLAIELAAEIDDKQTESGALNNIGMVHHENGDFDKAFAHYQQAATLAELQKDLKNSCSYYNNLGALLKEFGHHQRALGYYRKALQIAETTGYNGVLSTILLNIGSVLQEQNETDEALDYFNQALAISRLNNDNLNLIAILNRIGSLSAHKQLFEVGLQHHEEALQLAKSIDYKFGILHTLKEMAATYQKRGLPRKAIHYCSLALKQAEAIDDVEATSQLYEILSRSYADLGNYRNAYFFHKEFKAVNDTLFNAINSEMINDLEIQYQARQKEAENQLLRIQQAQQEATIQQRTVSAIAISLFLLLVSIVAFVLFRANRSKNAYNNRLKEQVAIRTKELEVSNEHLKKSNEELERFAYIASHDLKEPLRNIAGFIKLLERRIGNQLDHKSREYISFVAANAKQMHSLIEDVLEFSKVKNRKMVLEPVDMNRVIEQIKHAVSATLQEKNAIIYCKKLPVVVGHYTQLFLLCKNLIENGIKYNQSAIPQVWISCELNAKDHIIKIRDNGIGIDQEFHHKIFEMFGRLHDREKYQGSGMGLAICKKILQRLGGDIWIESHPGQGSCFFFSLPRQAATAPSADTQIASRASEAGPASAQSISMGT